MFEWKVEDLKLLNEKCNVYLEKEKIYDCENKLSRKEKIEFVDKNINNKLSYLLSLIDKFNIDKESIKKDNGGNIKTNSLKSWIKKNDTKYDRPIIDDWFKYGKYNILGCVRYIYSDNKDTYDFYNDLVDEVFHRQLKKCENLEREYFKEHDEYSILKSRLENYSCFYNKAYSFNTHISYCSDGNIYIYDDNENKRKITIEECRTLIGQYEKLEKYIEQLSNEIDIINIKGEKNES